MEQGLDEDTAEKVSRLGGLDAIGAASEAQLVAVGLPKLKARRLRQLLSSRSAHTPGDIKVRANTRALKGEHWGVESVHFCSLENSEVGDELCAEL